MDCRAAGRVFHVGVWLLAILCLASSALPARAGDVEPKLTIADTEHVAAPEIALTFDACSGAADRRILDVLVAEKIPATIFVTHRWLARNAPALAILLAHRDLFEIENHGDHHVPAITDAATVFGLKTAGTIDGVRHEIDGGAAAVLQATGSAPHWFRGATARYSRDAVGLIAAEGYRLAGYSLNADVGASLPALAVEKRIAKARSGDVLIAHINQPSRPAGAGVIAGILDLKKRGFRFVRLDEVATKGSDQ